MSGLFKAELGALKQLITALNTFECELDNLKGSLYSAYQNFECDYVSPDKGSLISNFNELFGYVHQAYCKAQEIQPNLHALETYIESAEQVQF